VSDQRGGSADPGRCQVVKLVAPMCGRSLVITAACGLAATNWARASRSSHTDSVQRIADQLGELPADLQDHP
jgi:hypothetical protein